MTSLLREPMLFSLLNKGIQILRAQNRRRLTILSRCYERKVTRDSGALDDLAHVSSWFCLADPLAKASALADELVKVVNTGILSEADIRPPFRELLQRKASLIEWMMDNVENVATAIAFLGTDVTEEIYEIFYCRDPNKTFPGRGAVTAYGGSRHPPAQS